jgi:hypothetical protein
MRTLFKFGVLMALASLGSGCLNDANRRADGLTDGAGNSMASNSVMQMVDPWQDGVQDTRLLVPAARSTASASAADDAADAKTSQTTSGSGN